MESWYDFSLWWALWYVQDMLVVFCFYYILRRLVKTEKTFLIVTGIVFVIATTLHSIPELFSWGWFRAFSAMSIGILISYLPKLQLKRQWVLVFPLLLAWGFALKCLLFDFTFLEEELLDYVAYPAIIYLTFQFTVHVKPLDYLGSLSFGLYAYQSIPRFMDALGYENPTLSFIIILSMTLITDLLKRIMRHGKKKTPQANPPAPLASST